MKWTAIIVLACVPLLCMAEKNYREVGALFSEYVDKEKLDRVSRGNVYPVSMSRLIADPSYDNKHVTVRGVLSCVEKRPMLFMNEFSYRVFNITEVIYLPQMNDDLRGKCEDRAEAEAVGISGKFVRPDPETIDSSIGRLEWVSAITFSGFSYEKSPIFD